MTKHQKKRCTATTQLGEACRNWAMIGYDVCRTHRVDLDPPSSGPPGNQHARSPRSLLPVFQR